MKCWITTLIIMAGFLGFSQGAPLPEGSPAPEVEAVNQAGEQVLLSSFYEKGPTLIYFYPKADTPGCTAQACSLRDAYEDLTDAGIQVIGVSRDSEAAQAAFKEKYNLPFTLLADRDGKVIEAFGVPTRMGFASRQAFLIVDGKVAWMDASASTKKQAQDVLEAWKNLP